MHDRTRAFHEFAKHVWILGMLDGHECALRILDLQRDVYIVIVVIDDGRDFAQRVLL
jgi:hypothetical protein